MVLNEILMVIGFILALIIPSLLLNRACQTLKTFIKLLSGLFLLILIWFFADGSSVFIKLMLTTIIISGAFKTINDYLYFARQKKRIGNPLFCHRFQHEELMRNLFLR